MVLRWALGAVSWALPAVAMAGGNTPPVAVADATPLEPVVGEPIQFSSAGSIDPDAAPQRLQFAWDFGDGSPPSALADPTHAYASAGHYSVTLTVSDGAATDEVVIDAVALAAPSPVAPSRSSAIAVSPDDQWVAVVNPDSNSVSLVDADDLAVVEIDVGVHPRSLAWSVDGARLFVACMGDNELWVLDPAGAVLEQLPTDHQPFGVAVAPAGERVVVTHEGAGTVSVLDSNDYALLTTIAVEPTPRAIAIPPAGTTAWVTHFLTFGDVGRVSVVDLVAGGVLDVVELAEDDGPDTDTSGRGFPGLLGAAAIDPALQTLWIGGQKQNTGRGEYVDGTPLAPRNRIRGLLAPIDLDAGSERFDARLDTNEADSVSGFAFSPRGRWVYATHQGAGTLSVYDLPAAADVDVSTGAPVPFVARVESGDAPQGIALRSDGARAYVTNYMSRNVAVFDLADPRDPRLQATVTVTAEVYPPDVARGKVLFHRSRSPAHSEGNYIACAGCHPDGGHDGRTWDFTQFGEGLRNTIDLRGHAGTAHGPVHWTANFDEIQDFENDIQNGFGGDGLLGGGAVPHAPLSPSHNAGRSEDLDALAAYVSSLDAFPPSPHRERDGSLNEAALRGRDLFFAPDTGCDDCHVPPRFTDSRLTDDPSQYLKHVVGTFGPGSGVSGALPAFDTPTVLGIWASPPYLHNGAAASLHEVLVEHNARGLHGFTAQLTDEEIDDLVIYMLSLQGSSDEYPEEPPGTSTGSDASASGSGSEGATDTGGATGGTTSTSGSPDDTSGTTEDPDARRVGADEGCGCTTSGVRGPWLLFVLLLGARRRSTARTSGDHPRHLPRDRRRRLPRARLARRPSRQRLRYPLRCAAMTKARTVRWVLAVVFLMSTACGWFSCESPIEKERRELQEAGESTEAVIYRGLKVTLRSAPIDPEAGPPDASATKIRLLTHRVLERMTKGQAADESPMSAEDYALLAKELYELRDELRVTDEDDYPTLLAQIAATYGAPSAVPPWYGSDWEHLVLAMLWVASQKAPPGIVIYEIGELDPNGIDEPGVRVAARLLRSLAFLQRGWPWLTDEESTAYLDDLASQRDEVIGFTRTFQGAPEGASDDVVYAQWHAPGVLVRGLARHQKEEEELALDDFDAFLADAETLGLDNEVVWLIGVYVGLKREDADRALTNLRKLEGSEILGEQEKKLVTDAIEAVENRDPESAFNAITDKVLIGKIAGAYVLRVLGEVDWRQELEKTESGRALLAANDSIGAEVERIQAAFSPEQLEGLKSKAADATRRLGHEARERASKIWHRDP